MLTATSLFVGLDQSSWIMWTAEGMRWTLMIALTMELVSITVVIMKMQEWFVQKVQLDICMVSICNLFMIVYTNHSVKFKTIIMWPMCFQNYIFKVLVRRWHMDGVKYQFFSYICSCSLQQYWYSVSRRKKPFGGSSRGVLPGTVGDSVWPLLGYQRCNSCLQTAWTLTKL